MLRDLALAAALLIHAGAAQAQAAEPRDRVGDAFDIRLTITSESSTDDGSSSSTSRSGGQMTERVIAVHDTGVELEFDLPAEATDSDRAREWQWPARVLKSADGSLQLLNAAELEGRVDAWLTAGEIPREACGHWIFTWNAFKIECDPQSVIGALAAFDLRPGDLSDGAPYSEPGGLGPGVLRLESTTSEGSTFVAETPVDAAFVRRQRADADLVVADIMGEPKTLEEALQARAAEQITGVITTSLTTDPEGRVIRRRTVTNMTTAVGGVVERATATRTAERRRLETPET